MPSYDEDFPTEYEEHLLKQLEQTNDEQQRLRTIIEIKNLVSGSKRCKNVFFRLGAVENLFNFLKEHSSTSMDKTLFIELIDCLSSFVKCSNKEISQRLIEAGLIQYLFNVLSSREDSIELCESSLRCLRSFFFPTNLSHLVSSKVDYANSYLVPLSFVLLSDQESQQISTMINPLEKQHSGMEQISPVQILFNHPHFLDTLARLLSTSKLAQMIIVEIFSSLCIDNQRQEQLFQRDLGPVVMHLLLENIQEKQINAFQTDKMNLVSLTNDYLIGLCLKFFCSLCYENETIGRHLHEMISPETHQTLSEIISNLLCKNYQPVIVSYNAAKYFVNLCKSKVLPADHPSVALESLSTLIHLSNKSVLNKCVYFYIECFQTLIYLLDGNSTLHHLAIYNEQFLNQLFIYFFTPAKLFDATVDEMTLIQIRASSLTLLAVLASNHEDIKKRIAEQENFMSKAIECCRSNQSSLKLAAFRLFHSLSRSVPQLRTTFNDTVCDMLLEAIQSSDLPLMKIASCVLSNFVLEFSSYRTRLLDGGILNILIKLLTHSDHELRLNCIWALQNLSYFASSKVKQNIVNGLTIDGIYSLLEQCNDDQFLLCLVSLLRNIFDEKDTDVLLTMFNPVKLLTTLEKLHERKTTEKIRQTLNTLINHLNSSQQRSSSESVTGTCRTSLLPEFNCDEMDQLDCPRRCDPQ